MVIYLQMGKIYMAKTPPGDFKVTTPDNLLLSQQAVTSMAKTPPGNFKVTTPDNPLLSQQAVTSKGIPVSYTNLQLNPYPNTQLDLFCSDNLSF